MSNTFDDLFVDAAVLNETLLKETLAPAVRLGTDGSVLFQDSSTDTIKKVVYYLLANKVLKTKGIKQDEPEGPKQISQGTGIPEGTVKGLVIRLSTMALVTRTKNGQYYVPNHALIKVREWLTS